MAEVGHESRNSDAHVFSNLGILTQGPRSSPWLNFVGVHKSPNTLSKIKHVCVSVCVCAYEYLCVCGCREGAHSFDQIFSEESWI